MTTPQKPLSEWELSDWIAVGELPDTVARSLTAEQNRIIAILNTIKDGTGDLESVSGYWVREELDACIESIKAHRPG